MALEDFGYQPLGTYPAPEYFQPSYITGANGYQVPVTGPAGSGSPYNIPISTGAGFDPNNPYAASSPVSGMNGPYLGSSGGTWSINQAPTNPYYNSYMMHPMYDTTYGYPNQSGGSYTPTSPSGGVAPIYDPNAGMAAGGLFGSQPMQPSGGSYDPLTGYSSPAYPQPSSGALQGSVAGSGGSGIMLGGYNPPNFISTAQGPINTVTNTTLPGGSSVGSTFGGQGIYQPGAPVIEGTITDPLTGHIMMWNGSTYTDQGAPQSTHPNQIVGGVTLQWDGTKYTSPTGTPYFWTGTEYAPQPPLQGGATTTGQPLEITQTNIQQPGDTLLPQLLGMLMGGSKGGGMEPLQFNMPESPGYPASPEFDQLTGPSLSRSGSPAGASPLWNITPGGEVPRFNGPGLGNTAPGAQAQPQGPGSPAGPGEVFIPGVGAVPMPQGPASSANPLTAYAPNQLTAEAPQQGGPGQQLPWTMPQFPGMPQIPPQFPGFGPPPQSPVNPMDFASAPSSRINRNDFSSMKAMSEQELAKQGPLGVPEEAMFKPDPLPPEAPTFKPEPLKGSSEQEQEADIMPPAAPNIANTVRVPDKAEQLGNAAQKAKMNSTKLKAAGDALAANSSLPKAEEEILQKYSQDIDKINSAPPPPSLTQATNDYKGIQGELNDVEGAYQKRLYALGQIDDPMQYIENDALEKTNRQFFGIIAVDPKTGQQSGGWERGPNGQVYRDPQKAKAFDLVSAGKNGMSRWGRFENPQQWAATRADLMKRYNEQKDRNLKYAEQTNPLGPEQMKMLETRRAALQQELNSARSVMHDEQRMFLDRKKEAYDLANKFKDTAINNAKDKTKGLSDNAKITSDLYEQAQEEEHKSQEFALNASKAQHEAEKTRFGQEMDVRKEKRDVARFGLEQKKFGFEEEEAAAKRIEREEDRGLRRESLAQGRERIAQSAANMIRQDKTLALAAQRFNVMSGQSERALRLREGQDVRAAGALTEAQRVKRDEMAHRAAEDTFRDAMNVWRAVSSEVSGLANFGARAVDRGLSHSEQVAKMASGNRDAIIKATGKAGLSPDALIKLWQAMPEEAFR